MINSASGFSQEQNSMTGVLLANGALVAQASTSLRLPEVWTGWVAYWPVRNLKREWKVEVDVDYVRW
jgi:long-chain fatty acid transport protein